MNSQLDYTWTTTPQPHTLRTRKILKEHPEIRELFGRTHWTLPVTTLVVGIQFLTAFLVHDLGLWWTLLAAATVGATCGHSLFVIIHECAHNLAFRRPWANKLLGILANLPSVVPSAIGFRNFHLLHHRYQGELAWDADLAGSKEAAWVGRSPLRKAIWLLAFPFIEGLVRPIRVHRINVLEPWSLFNASLSVGAGVLVWALWGPWAFVYLIVSLFFSIGLHPYGGRWIQEHYMVDPVQETYSYYGKGNFVTLNVGYHNEHHDFMMIPWTRIRKVKEIAPEYYDSLVSHRSWTRLVIRFIFDRELTLFSRTVRPDHKQGHGPRLDSKGTQAIVSEWNASQTAHHT